MNNYLKFQLRVGKCVQMKKYANKFTRKHKKFILFIIKNVFKRNI